MPIHQTKSDEIGDTLIAKCHNQYYIPEYRIMDDDNTFMSSPMEYLFNKFDIKIKTIAPCNHQSLQAKHGIKSLSNILTKHLTHLGQMLSQSLQLATLAYNTFNTPKFGNCSPCELVFGWIPSSLLNLESTPDIKASGTFKEYCELLNKRLKYLHKLLLDFKSKRLAMKNKNRDFFQYNSGDLVYIISPLISQFHTTLRKVMIKYVGPVVIYKITDPHYYLLMTVDGKILRGLSKYKRLKPANIRTNQGNAQNLAQLKQVINAGLKI